MKKIHNPRRAKAATTTTPPAANRLRHILVVDDDAGLRQLGTAVLIRHGYCVYAAKDSVAGWKALQTRAYDLLITDLDMPRLSCLKLMKKLRAARMDLPVIVASGTLTPQELNRTSWLQLSGALLKPFSPDQLLYTVQAVLGPTNGASHWIAPPPNWQNQSSADNSRR